MRIFKVVSAAMLLAAVELADTAAIPAHVAHRPAGLPPSPLSAPVTVGGSNNGLRARGLFGLGSSKKTTTKPPPPPAGQKAGAGGTKKSGRRDRCQCKTSCPAGQMVDPKRCWRCVDARRGLGANQPPPPKGGGPGGSQQKPPPSPPKPAPKPSPKPPVKTPAKQPTPAKKESPPKKGH